MAFGLKLRKVPKDEIEEKVYNAAEILGLVPYLRESQRLYQVDKDKELL